MPDEFLRWGQAAHRDEPHGMDGVDGGGGRRRDARDLQHPREGGAEGRERNRPLRPSAPPDGQARGRPRRLHGAAHRARNGEKIPLRQARLRAAPSRPCASGRGGDNARLRAALFHGRRPARAHRPRGRADRAHEPIQGLRHDNLRLRPLLLILHSPLRARQAPVPRARGYSERGEDAHRGRRARNYAARTERRRLRQGFEERLRLRLAAHRHGGSAGARAAPLRDLAPEGFRRGHPRRDARQPDDMPRDKSARAVRQRQDTARDEPRLHLGPVP